MLTPAWTVLADHCANAPSSIFDGCVGCPGMLSISSQKKVLKCISLYNGNTVGGQEVCFPLHNGTEITQREALCSEMVQGPLKESPVRLSLQAISNLL